MAVSAPVSIDPDWLVERVARRVVELLDERQQQPPGLVDAATLARLLGISRSTVYDRASDLGAVRIGCGARPRLRFDVETARKAMVAGHSGEPRRAEVPAAIVRRRSKRARTSAGVRLLPVKGQEAA